MSLEGLPPLTKEESFPRVSGDEPREFNSTGLRHRFSPRERG